ncbi:hypothetical protein [Emticicia sp. SJ17W-69]|uniref:hypothetical protein n=1 Tax=Emticicia sp. SJ17W-69 TaxID=3421657 RepID=UPI003EBDD4F2
MKNILITSLFSMLMFSTMAQIIETPSNSILTVKSGITIPDTSAYRINGAAILKLKSSTNLFLGLNVGNMIAAGQNNVFLGSNSNGTLPTITNSVAIGTNAKVAINDAIILGDTVNTNIKVGIGTAWPKYRLDVKGIVNMRVAFNSPSIKINDRDFLALDSEGKFLVTNFKIKYDDQKDWSDKVFDENYKLMDIVDVMKFAKENKHLPNIPSAKQVVESGVEINQIVSKLLEKIEELTIYNAKQSEEISELKKRMVLWESNKK